MKTTITQSADGSTPISESTNRVKEILKHPNKPTPKAANSETETAASAKPYDPFDPDTMRLSQATLKGSAKKLVLNYTIRKTPRRGSFIRVHPDPAYQHITYVFVDKDEAGLEKETYLITPEIRGPAGR